MDTQLGTNIDGNKIDAELTQSDVYPQLPSSIRNWNNYLQDAVTFINSLGLVIDEANQRARLITEEQRNKLIHNNKITLPRIQGVAISIKTAIDVLEDLEKKDVAEKFQRDLTNFISSASEKLVAILNKIEEMRANATRVGIIPEEGATEFTRVRNLVVGVHMRRFLPKRWKLQSITETLNLNLPEKRIVFRKGAWGLIDKNLEQ